MMSYYLRFLLIAAFILSGVQISSAQQTVILSDETALCGESVFVPLTVTGASSLGAFGVDVSYDNTCITYVGTSAGSDTSSWAGVSGSEISPGVIRVGGFRGSASTISGSAELAVLEFQCAPSSCDCSSALTMSNLINDFSGASTDSGSATCETPTPEVVVLDGATNLTDGVSTVDLGSSPEGGANLVRTFTVQNTGTGTLTTSNLSTPAGYQILNGLSSAIAPSGSDTFQVQIPSTTNGTYSGTISFDNNDSDENPFNFSITGTITEAPEISVSENGSNLTDNVGTIDFGTVFIGSASPSKTFTVSNSGSAALTPGTVTVPNGYSISESLDSTIPLSSSDMFTVELDTSSVGTFTGEISIPNNDANEDPFRINVTGTVQGLSEVAVTGPSGDIQSGVDTVDFGMINEGATAVTITFTVENNGSATLSTSNLSVPAGYTITNSLSSSIGIGQSDDFAVRLNSTSPGDYNGTISFNTNDMDEDPFTFDVTGKVNAVSEIAVTFNSAPLLDGGGPVDFGSVPQNTTPPTRTFTVSNTASADLILGTPSVPAGFQITEALSSTISSGNMDTFTITMLTDDVGTPSGTVQFTTNDPNASTFDFTIQGIITATPEIAVFDDQTEIMNGDGPINFGTATQGDTALTKIFTIENIGTDDLNLSGISVPVGFTLIEDIDPIIAPTESDTFTVKLTTDMTGDFSGDIEFDSDDLDEPMFAFSIEGSVVTAGTQIPDIVVLDDQSMSLTSGSALDFETATQGDAPLVQVLTVQNNGVDPLMISQLNIPVGFTLVEALDNTIQPSNSDTFSVRLDTSVLGNFAGELEILSNDPDTPNFTLDLSGQINAAPIPMPDIVVSDSMAQPINNGATLDLGNAVVDDPALSATITVENQGADPLEIVSLEIPLGFTLTEALISSVPSSSSDSFTVELNTQSTGMFSGDINITTNDPDTPVFTISLNALITSAPPETNPDIAVLESNIPLISGNSSLDAGSVLRLSSPAPTFTFTVENNGDADLTPVAGVGSGFTITEGLNATITPDNSDTLTVQLDVSSTGFFDPLLEITSNDPDTPSFYIRLTGEVLPAPSFEISDGVMTLVNMDSVDLGSTPKGSTALSQIFTVTNTGIDDLIISGPVLPEGYTLGEGLTSPLSPTQMDTFEVILNTNTADTFTGDLLFTTNDTSNQQFAINLTGEVTPIPELAVLFESSEVEPGSGVYDLGTFMQGQTPENVSFELSNIGGAALNVSDITVTNGFIIQSTGDAVINPGASTTITVSADTTQSGFKFGVLTIETDDPNQPTFNLVLSTNVLITGNKWILQ